MQLIDSLRSEADMASIDDLARTFGLTSAQAEAVVGSIAPRLADRIERNSLSRGGLADLVAMLGEVRDNRQMLGASALGSDDGRQYGNSILEQILVNKDASRALAAKASAASGISETLIRTMLPYIATMVVGWLTNKASGGLNDVLGKLPDLMGGQSPGRGQSPAQDRSPAPGGGFPLPAPSSSPSGGSMLPGPDGMSAPTRNPYGDLSDVIRRGGGRVDGNPLGSIVRNILGSLLGFRSSGIVSWLIRIVVMRYGWTILRTILSRVLLGR